LTDSFVAKPRRNARMVESRLPELVPNRDRFARIQDSKVQTVLLPQPVRDLQHDSTAAHPNLFVAAAMCPISTGVAEQNHPEWSDVPPPVSFVTQLLSCRANSSTAQWRCSLATAREVDQYRDS